jgi:restriction system-associated AAA family ATPase
MKLLRLKLNSDFRSLAAGFEVNFLREWDHDRCFEFHPYCLAGRNGSGKSNVLEALAAIFYHIECIYLGYRPDGFASENEDNLEAPGFNTKVSEPDAFELEYIFPDDTLKELEPWPKSDTRPVAHIRITKVAGERPRFECLNRAEYEDTKQTELSSRAAIQAYLPKYILGYSSGHNEILSLPFFKMRFIHFDEYQDKLIKRVDYPNRPEGRMIYLDDQFSQVILLCHFLFPSEAITRVFKDKIDLEGFRCFRLIIRRFHRVQLEQEASSSSSSSSSQDSEPEETVELTKNLTDIINKLIQCSTTHYEDRTPYAGDEDNAHDLYLDFWIDDEGETRRAFHTHFADSAGGSEELNKAASAINLFHALQTLLTLNYYKVDLTTKSELYESASLYVNETIPTPASHERIARFKDSRIIKPGVDDRIYLKNLSDGEHQLLHTIGLCLLFRHTSSLFLLDEPETHLNPDWRASYISTLRAALEADESTSKVMREVLLTSHSPFIISDCHKENVLVFTKDTMTQKVTCDRPQFQTFGASATLITNEIFDRPETIGDFANDELKRLESLAGQVDQNPLQIARQLDRALGDSIEKTLAINRILGGSKES